MIKRPALTRCLAAPLAAFFALAGGHLIFAGPQPLVANAGTDRRVAPGRITLDGRGSRHPAAAPLSYQWSFTGGPAAVRLSNDTTATPSVEMTRPGTYTFGLRVYDPYRTSQLTEVAISVDDLPPSCGAGTDRLVPTGSVPLKGFATDPNGLPLTVDWVQTKGPMPAAIADPRALSTWFSVPVSGTGQYIFTLRVHDGALTTVSSPLTIDVDDLPEVHGYSNPVNLEPGGKTELNGSGSADKNPEDNPLVHAWTLASGPETGTLTAPGEAYAQFSAKRAGEYALRLEVTSRKNRRSAKTDVVVKVKNVAPVATASAKLAVHRDEVELDGAATDENGDPLTYEWKQLDGPETLALSDAAAAAPTVRIRKPGAYTLQLVAKDAELESPPVTTRIEAKNTPPVPRIPPALLVPPGPCVLDGAGSVDADGDPVFFLWRQVAGPPAALSDPASPRPVAILSLPGTYVFELTVNDGVGFSFPARMTVTVAK